MAHHGPRHEQNQDFFDVIAGFKDLMSELNRSSLYHSAPGNNSVIVDALKNKRKAKPRSLFGYIPLIMNSFIQNMTSITNVVLGRVQNPKVREHVDNLNENARRIDQTSDSLGSMLGGLMQIFAPGFRRDRDCVNSMLNGFMSPSTTPEQARETYRQRMRRM